jgi:hypothetical protein
MISLSSTVTAPTADTATVVAILKLIADPVGALKRVEELTSATASAREATDKASAVIKEAEAARTAANEQTRLAREAADKVKAREAVAVREKAVAEREKEAAAGVKRAPRRPRSV